MNVTEIITDKRDGKTLSGDRIGALIAAYAEDNVPDYQMSAFAMAVYFQGMDLEETVALTAAMVASGETMQWSNSNTRVDKHSTGGIGDKVSLVLAPLLAAAGVDVPMISGRGLGVTGGTIDKLESIPGFRCELSMAEFRYALNAAGSAIVSASENLAIADKKLYALRDVTGTIPSIPLITASILSKKLAAGLDALVLDVKWGNGAFMKTQDEARELAKSIIDVANKLGTKTTAIISDMNQPLGRMIGNAVEVNEAVDVLQGDGPADVLKLTLELGAEVLVSAGIANSLDTGREKLQAAIDDGSAMKKFTAMAEAQNGDLSAGRRVAKQHTIAAIESGYINRINTERIGMAVIEMGGGRKLVGDAVDHSVGVEMLAKIGDAIEAGQPLAHVFCDDAVAGYASELVGGSFGITPVQESAPELIVERVQA